MRGKEGRGEGLLCQCFCSVSVSEGTVVSVCLKGLLCQCV